MANTSATEKKQFIGKIKSLVNSSFLYKLVFEFVGAFTLIFLIDLGLSLGELNGQIWFLKFFHVIYDINFLTAIWISSFTLIAFIVFERTCIASNAVTLVIQYKNKEIIKRDFYSSFGAQFLGGIIASIFVYFIMMGFAIWFIHDYSNYSDFTNELHIMGGSSEYLRGFFTHGNDNSYQAFNFYKPIDFTSKSSGIRFGFSSMRGIINAFIIGSSFIFMNLIGKKYNSNFLKIAVRYIMLIVLISLSVILSANTTNWVRLISPIIVSGAFTHNAEGGYRILMTLVFMIFQSLGLIFILLSHHLIKEGEENGV